MKLVNGIVGTPIPSDYEALRAALLAAQATTPTARVAKTADAARCPVEDRTAALHDLLTVAVAAADDAIALGNSFAPIAPEQGGVS